MNCTNCNGAPNLSLNLNPAASNEHIVPAPSSSHSQRPKSTPFAKAHRVVQKDYYRLMKSENHVDKHLKKKKDTEFGRAPLKTALEIKNSKFKSVGEVISE